MGLNAPLAGRAALVTGSGRGLGRAIAARLASDGAAMAVHFHRSEKGAQTLVDEIAALGATAVLVRGDLREPDACRRVVATAEEQLGRLDILVLNAGVAKSGPLMDADFERIRETLEVNLVSALYAAAVAVPGMLRRRFGRIIAIASPVGEHGGLQGQCAYAASKAGLIGFIKTLANELSPRADFTANAVSPGLVATDMSAFGIREFGEQLRTSIPLGRFGSAADVAAAVAFLVSPEASYVNGQNLAVDGGYSLKYVSRRRSKEDA